MTELPLEIITIILSRLPVKPLLRFRCVSKSWCSLIDTPHFIKTHLNLSIENHTDLTLILQEAGGCQNKNTLYSFDFYSLHTPIVFNNHFQNSYVLGSCNGLLLLKTRDHHQLVLFNPSTRHFHNVPATPFEYPRLGGLLNPLIEKYGLGYDSFNDDYKVIKVVMFYESLKCIKVEAMVYNLNSNIWREIGDFPYHLLPVHDNSWGAHVNGALHMVVGVSYNFDSSKLIAALDITYEEFYLVPKPDYLDKRNVEISVDVLGGCLCLVDSYSDYTDVWLMKVYGVKESWTKLLSISLAMVWSYVWVRPLGYSKSHDEVLLNFGEKKLMWYDLKRRNIRNVESCDLPKMFYVEVCVGSLVPLNSYGTQEATLGEKNPKMVK